MSKNILTMALLLATASFTFSQLKVVAPHDNVGIGITPDAAAKLHVKGITRVTPLDGINPTNNKPYPAVLQIGQNRELSADAFIDLYSIAGGSWVGRFLSNESGITTFSHKGVGRFQLRTFLPDSPIYFVTNNGTNNRSRLSISDKGKVGIGTDAPTEALHVVGKAVKTVGGSAWGVASDERLKTNIEEYTEGLSSILKIKPVEFNYNGKAGIDNKAKEVGVIAQEFRNISSESVFQYNYTKITPTEDDTPYKKGATEEYLGVNPSRVIWMLVNAVKEQNAKIEDFEKRFEKLSVTSNALDHVHYNTVILNNEREKALLSQNAPNPFTNNTKIEYFIPINAKTATMSFVDINGKEIKHIKIDHTGFGTLNVELKDLSSGIYAYTLIVDYKTVDTKEMLLSK